MRKQISKSTVSEFALIDNSDTNLEYTRFSI